MPEEHWVGRNPQGLNADQAMADCRAKSDQVAASGMNSGMGFAVAMQQQYMNDCMAAYGFRLE